jgi:ABC-2 type transport system ATP-binding protein
MPDAFTIETIGLRKEYGATAALRGVDLKVPSGSIHGFLGRNGAGKTTTLKILIGMVRPTGGSARVFGLDASNAPSGVAIRARVAFVSEDKDLMDAMSVEEILRFTASFYPQWRADLEKHYLKKFELPAGRTVKELSKGMRTKLTLVLALARGARLLILDEPTSGLDPAVAEEVLQALVAHTASEEVTVFFSSHQIAEVEQIAERVTILDRGRTVVDGSLDDLRENYRRIHLVFEGNAPEPALTAPGVVRTRKQGRTLSIFASTGSDRIVQEARALNPVFLDVAPVTLKDIFLESVAREVGDREDGNALV